MTWQAFLFYVLGSLALSAVVVLWAWVGVLLIQRGALWVGVWWFVFWLVLAHEIRKHRG